MIETKRMFCQAEARRRERSGPETDTDWKVSNSSSCHGNINTSSVTIHSLHSLDCSYLNHHPSARLFAGVGRKTRSRALITVFELYFLFVV